MKPMSEQAPPHEKNQSAVSGDRPVVSIPIHPTGIYTYKEAAALSKCSYVTIWRAVAGGRLEAAAIGNQPRIIGEKLLKWIKAGGEAGRSKATM
jgi:excisionase family DNA binding protein